MLFRSLPIKFSWFGAWNAWTRLLIRINQWNQGKSAFIDTISRLATFRIYQEKIASVPPTSEVLCPAIRDFAKSLLLSETPLLIVFTPHAKEGIEANWGGLAYDPEDLRKMIACAKATGARVDDLSGEQLGPESFAADHIHYSALGAEWLAARLAMEMRLIAHEAEKPEK